MAVKIRHQAHRRPLSLRSRKTEPAQTFFLIPLNTIAEYIQVVLRVAMAAFGCSRVPLNSKNGILRTSPIARCEVSTQVALGI